MINGILTNFVTKVIIIIIIINYAQLKRAFELELLQDGVLYFHCSQIFFMCSLCLFFRSSADLQPGLFCVVVSKVCFLIVILNFVPSSTSSIVICACLRSSSTSFIHFVFPCLSWWPRIRLDILFSFILWICP